MRRTRNYGSYKGRSTAGDKLRTVAIILAVLVFLAGAGLLYGQKYLVYTDGGVRWDVPFLDREEPEVEPDPGNVEVVVDPDGATSQEEPDTPAPAEEPWISAVELPLSALEQGDLAGQAQALGANGVILDMKDDRGNLGYVSKQSLAPAAQGNNETLERELAAAKEKGLYLIARVSCFRDHALAESKAYAIETNPGRRWSDLDGIRWSSPASEGVQDYLAGIVAELSALGFDEILLENWSYPTRENGHLEYIKKGTSYDPENLNTVVADFLTKAQVALEGKNVRLSVRAPAALVRDGKTAGGAELTQLGGLSGRIWLENAAAGQEKLDTAGLWKDGRAVVEIVAQLVPDQTKNQGSFAQK